MKRVVIFVLIMLVLAASGCYRDIQEGAYTNISAEDEMTEGGDDVTDVSDTGESMEEGQVTEDTGATIEGTVTVVEPEMTEDNVSDTPGEPMDDVTGAVVEPMEPVEQPVEQPVEAAPADDVSKYRQAFVEREGYPYVIEVNEGELVKPVIRALDPDQEDSIVFRYGPPLSSSGEWQTKQGQAGYYVVPITASDGELETTTDILIIVNSVNGAPVIEAIADVTLAEGQTISFQPRVSDPDGDEFTVTYTGWMTSSTYQTTFDDSGVYMVNIIAADDYGQSVETVQVTVTDMNRAPIMGLIEDVAVDAGQLVQLSAVVADPDADTVTVTYSEPLDSNGQWQTTESDIGSFAIKVTASDGELQTSQDITVTVRALNSAPVLSPLAPVTVNEGETVVLQPTAVDPDGDEVVISYSGWMTSNTYTTTFSDAGSYVVTVTVSDGMESTSQNVVVTVQDVNRAPQFVFG